MVVEQSYLREIGKKEKENEEIYITREKVKQLRGINNYVICDRMMDVIKNALYGSTSELERFDYIINQDAVIRAGEKFISGLTSKGLSPNEMEYEVQKFLDSVYYSALSKREFIEKAY